MDDLIFGWINGFAGHPTLDYLAEAFAVDWVFTGVLQLVFFWYFWFDDPVPSGRRETLLRGLAGILIAIVVARILAHLLPFRLRPLQTPLMHPLSTPVGPAFDQASSFPSDTTAYFVAFGTALWFVSRPVGTTLVLYAMTVMTLPRIYLGLHFPSDCVAGWLVGIVVPVIAMRAIPEAIAAWVASWSERQPGIFYALLFAVTAEMSNAFRDARATLHALGWIVRNWPETFDVTAAVVAAVLVAGSAFGLHNRIAHRRQAAEKSARPFAAK
jgi:undecaprenyl-diphosphatase